MTKENKFNSIEEELAAIENEDRQRKIEERINKQKADEEKHQTVLDFHKNIEPILMKKAENLLNSSSFNGIERIINEASSVIAKKENVPNDAKINTTAMFWIPKNVEIYSSPIFKYEVSSKSGLEAVVLQSHMAV